MADKNDNRWEVTSTTEIATGREFAPATMALLRRQALVIRHRLMSALSKGGYKAIVGRAFHVAAYLTLPVAAMIKFGWSKVTFFGFVSFLWTQVLPRRLVDGIALRVGDGHQRG